MARRVLLALALVAVAATGAIAAAQEVGPSTKTLVSGRKLQPIGDLVGLGNFPTGGAVTPDGRFLWTASSGRGKNDLRIVDVTTKKVIQTLPIPGTSGGIAIDPSSPTVYVSGVADSKFADQKSPAGTPGVEGDVVHVFTYDRGSGRAKFDRVIPVPPPPDTLPAQDFPPSNKRLSWPDRLAVSNDGKTLLVPLNLADAAAIVDTKSRSVKTVKTGSYPYGAAILPDGKTGLVTNEASGTVSVIDLQGARKTKDITVGPPLSHPEGIALDPAGKRAYVAVTNSDQVAVVDLDKLAVSRTLTVERPEGLGAAPVDVTVTPDGGRLLVAVSGADHLAVFRLPGATSASGRPAKVVRVRSPKSIARYRTAQLRARAKYRRQARNTSPARRRGLTRRYRRTVRSLRKRLLVGTTTTGCSGPSRKLELAYRRAVLRAATRRAKAVRRAKRLRREELAAARGRVARRRAATRYAVRRRAAQKRFSSATRAAKRELPSIVACSGPPPPPTPDFGRIGSIPTASQPMAVAVTEQGRLLAVSAKGLGVGPNPQGPVPTSPADSDDRINEFRYLPSIVSGAAQVVDMPDDAQIAAMTPGAEGVVKPLNAQRPPADTPLRPDGPIKYVFYIVKENRTYDQMLGDDPRGDGDPKLTLFGEQITPNLHALVKRFPLLDHVYANSEASIDGHFWTSAASVPDYVNRNWFQNYGGRGRPYDFPAYAVAFPPNGFLFDQADRQGISYFNYGEAIAGVIPLPDKDRSAEQTAAAARKLANSDIGNNPGGCYPNDGSIGKDIITGQTVYDTSLPAGANPTSASRFDCFQRRFTTQIATGTVPTFNYMVLGNDHTQVLTGGARTPRAMVADNDEGLGRIVDTISHSPIWSQTAIFVVEDDSQDGADHVDAHRIPANVISPYAKEGAVVSTRYDFLSVIRSMELIMGMKPLGFQDALGVPMYDAFQGTPNLAPYNYIAAKVNLNETNPTTGPGARASARLPAGLDVARQRDVDRLLWKSVHGWNSKPPPPGPNASGEAEREEGEGLFAQPAGGR